MSEVSNCGGDGDVDGDGDGVGDRLAYEAVWVGSCNKISTGFATLESKV